MPYVRSLYGDDNDHLSTSVFSLINISFLLRVILLMFLLSVYGIHISL